MKNSQKSSSIGTQKRIAKIIGALLLLSGIAFQTSCFSANGKVKVVEDSGENQVEDTANQVENTTEASTKMQLQTLDLSKTYYDYSVLEDPTFKLPSISDLSEELIVSIESAWSDYSPDIPLFSDRSSRTLSSLFYYGIYGDNCAVFFERTMLTAVTTISIDETKFSCSSSFILLACADGKIISLKEAYEKGSLTGEDLQTIKRVHDYVQLKRLEFEN